MGKYHTRSRWLSVASILLGLTIARAQTTEVVLHNFPVLPNGANVIAGVIRDSAGNLYGTTAGGGIGGNGVVYKVTPNGREIVLYSFTGGADGGNPQAGVVRDPSGNLYGTTYQGGSSNAGVVFKVDPAGHETVLYSFTGGSDGGYPQAGVIFDSAGNLYGTTTRGGTSGEGAIFILDPSGHETVLYSFLGGTDGVYPLSTLIRDTKGTLYGTTLFGGTASGDCCGTIFKLDTTGHKTTLYAFTGGTDGGYPFAGVVHDAAGNLYGTARGGTVAVVFKVDPSGHETVVYSFSGRSTDGRIINAGVVLDSAGNLYGTTVAGGASDQGTVFKVDPDGNQTVLYSFAAGQDGANPYAAVILDSAGNIYGTTSGGGPTSTNAEVFGNGTVFKLDPSGHKTILCGFAYGPDGANPYSSLIRDPAGNLYGTTVDGGQANAGVVFKIDSSGRESVLYGFCALPGCSDGAYPRAGVTRDSAGNLYGTTSSGGQFGRGVVFKLDTAGQQTVLYNFCGLANCADGAYPDSNLLLDSAGNLYGITRDGPSSGLGVLFKVDPTGHETILYSSSTAYAIDPGGSLIRDAAGNFYGTAVFDGLFGYGAVFQVEPAFNSLALLYSFTGGADGADPSGGVLRDSAGNLYGTARAGGAWNAGVVFKVDINYHETVLYSFTGGADGGTPMAGLIRDPQGNFYGTTNAGGASGYGVVFKLDPSGHETVLYSFTGGADGGSPYAGVIADPSSNLYGTTNNGGTKSGGVVFEIRP